MYYSEIQACHNLSMTTNADQSTREIEDNSRKEQNLLSTEDVKASNRVKWVETEDILLFNTH